MPASGGLHLYGVVPSTTASAGDLPDGAEFVPYQQIAALIRSAPVDPARQLRAHVLGYAELLDRLAQVGPVLPVRFGTVLPSRAEVVQEVLAPGYHAFQTALAGLAGKTQFTVRARYLADEVIREVLAERPETRRLQQRLRRAEPHRGADPARVRFGELVARAVTAKRAADREVLVQQLSGPAVAIALAAEQALEGDRVADLACLVEWGQAAQFEAAVDDLGQRWQARARLRLLGPMAPYDFAAEFVSGELVSSGPAGGR